MNIDQCEHRSCKNQSELIDATGRFGKDMKLCSLCWVKMGNKYLTGTEKKKPRRHKIPKLVKATSPPLATKAHRVISSNRPKLF